MKILMVNSLYHPNILGGAERLVQTLAEALVAAGNEAVVVSTGPQPGLRTGDVNGVKVYYVGARNLYWGFSNKHNPYLLIPFWHALDTYNPFMARQVGRILDLEMPDIVHTNNLRGFSVAVWRELRTRGLGCVHTLYDYYLVCPRSTMYRRNTNCESQCWSCQLYGALRRSMSSLPDAVVGVSSFTLGQHLQRGYFASTPLRQVIYSGYKFRGAPKEQKPVDAAAVRFGYLGSLSPQKGIEFLLRSLCDLPARGWEFWIGGKGTPDYEARLKGRHASGNISYKGFVRPEDFLPEIDVLVVPSVWDEPLPTVVVEAFTHGVPVIGSRRGGIPELIEDGRTGLLFDPAQPGSLEAALGRFIDDPRLAYRMREHVLQKAQEFVSEKMLKEYCEIYQRALRGDHN